MILGPAGCSLFGKGPGKGDPGNRRLHQLAADPIFSVLPPGAQKAELKLIPASYQKPSFEPGGWTGPGVTRTFESSSTPRSVYEFYGQRARAEGWTPTNMNALHVAATWRRTYANGAVGSLILTTDRPWEALPLPRFYQLNGGITLPR